MVSIKTILLKNLCRVFFILCNIYTACSDDSYTSSVAAHVPLIAETGTNIQARSIMSPLQQCSNKYLPDMTAACCWVTVSTVAGAFSKVLCSSPLFSQSNSSLYESNSTSTNATTCMLAISIPTITLFGIAITYSLYYYKKKYATQAV